MKILLVEDDTDTSDFIVDGLSARGAVVTHFDNAQEALDALQKDPFEAIIFDRLLPQMDGLQATKILRQNGNFTPIIMLTALGSIEDRINGLEAGADDYMVKPFAIDELYARIKALLRRQSRTDNELRLELGSLLLDRPNRSATRHGQPLDLLPREYTILEYLVQNAGELVTRTMLLETIWGYHFDPKTTLVQTHISRLRNKLDKPFEKDMIETIRGAGYVISEA